MRHRGFVDRLYLGRQVPAHRAALDLYQSYAADGDQKPLKMTVRAAVPIVKALPAAATRMQQGITMGNMKGM